MVSEYGSLPFLICHQLLSGQLDQCARLSFPCSLYWIQSLQLIFLSTKLNTCVCVWLVAMNSIILLWVISVYLKICDINYFWYLTPTYWVFADEHSLSFSLIAKKMSSVSVLINERKKRSKCFCEKEEKKSKCPKKNFQSVERGKNVSVEFRVFGKKWKKRFGKKNQSVFGEEF